MAWNIPSLMLVTRLTRDHSCQEASVNEREKDVIMPTVFCYIHSFPRVVSGCLGILPHNIGLRYFLGIRGFFTTLPRNILQYLGVILCNIAPRYSLGIRESIYTTLTPDILWVSGGSTSQHPERLISLKGMLCDKALCGPLQYLKICTISFTIQNLVLEIPETTLLSTVLIVPLSTVLNISLQC